MPEPHAELASRILYRDADVLVIDKPAGVAVHQAPGAGRTLDDGLDALRFGLKWTPVPAHRLDRDTSGCLVLGRHPQALRRLNQAFADGAMAKTYWAVVAGQPHDDAGEVNLPLLKVHRGRNWFMVADPAGQTAETHWRALGRGDGIAWLALTPRTGRTHQLRVHCASLGLPVLGDRTYGPQPPPGTRLHLHARSLAFKNGKRQITAEAPPPPHMLPALVACGYRAEAPRAQALSESLDPNGHRPPPAMPAAADLA